MKLLLSILLLLIGISVYSQQEFEICETGQTFTYSTQLDIDGYVEWFLNGEPIGEGDNININYTKPGDYQIVAIGYNLLDCPGSPVVFNVSVTQCDPLIYWIPNSFTPDGNEYNQIWGPILTSGVSVENFRLAVYNRWGQIIWETFDASAKWDGTYGGELVQSGTYVWTMSIDFLDNGGREIVTGHVTILK
jgi:gliding motility-associated-like protein